jgi:CBS domain-containing protein
MTFEPVISRSAIGRPVPQSKEMSMQSVSEVMTRNVRFISPNESVQRAAQLMDELNVGALPVCDGARLVGMVTDRDITVRATSAGFAPDQVVVDEVMSTDVRWCFEDQPLDDVMRQMADTQIRRVPVVSHDEAHRLVGIVSLGDIATKTRDDEDRQQAGQLMEQVSTPSVPDDSAPASSSDVPSADNPVADAEMLFAADIQADVLAEPAPSFFEVSPVEDPDQIAAAAPDEPEGANVPDRGARAAGSDRRPDVPGDTDAPGQAGTEVDPRR